MKHMILDVYSTTTRDTVVDQLRNTVQEQVGGPALFISQALTQQEVAFRLFEGAVAEVRIDISEQGERGCIQELKHNRLLDQGDKTRLVMCSTVLNEWDPSVLADKYKALYLDVQGFVRSPDRLGTKRHWNGFQGEWITKIACLKATQEELAFLPKESMEDQKTRILLVTRGAAGVDLYVRGAFTSFRPPRIVNASDTIGAGDTFFGCVTARLLLGDHPEMAVIEALEQTCRFLELKC